MKPIRGQQNKEVAHDPWEHNEQLLGRKDVIHVLSDAGAIESYETGRQIACGCGCLKPPGGFCAACSKTACVQCFGFCSVCHKPLCPAHSVYEPIPGGQSIRLCKPCHEAQGRRRITRRVGRILLSPFFRFEDDHAQR